MILRGDMAGGFGETDYAAAIPGLPAWQQQAVNASIKGAQAKDAALKVGKSEAEANRALEDAHWQVLQAYQPKVQAEAAAFRAQQQAAFDPSAFFASGDMPIYKRPAVIVGAIAGILGIAALVKNRRR